ncbi:hypothetical protein BpHYR1_026597 [Brachionus plicatilis]|uniref:Uncharacterized protein n=1 Tax=Brachionus plicatilis TaxID=10195 RepID=A0A3M7P5U0_BRAPC|nr:hypothetical protein BpHYR1_026597 [Brachionus plicatilis]
MFIIKSSLSGFLTLSSDFNGHLERLSAFFCLVPLRYKILKSNDISRMIQSASLGAGEVGEESSDENEIELGVQENSTYLTDL